MSIEIIGLIAILTALVAVVLVERRLVQGHSIIIHTTRTTTTVTTNPDGTKTTHTVTERT
jgi:hypothetical protein